MEEKVIDPEEIHQMAFEEGQPAEDGDGYLFTCEEFELFVDRLLIRINLSLGERSGMPPSNCRQRLMEEGKAYPKSSCQSCGKFSPKWKECNLYLKESVKF